LKKSIEIASTEGYLKNEANANLFLSEAYDAVGDYRLAYRTHLRYTELHDRFINEQKNAVVSELQTKYETEKKDGEIATLSQKAQIQALQISQRNTQLIGAGIALLVLILGGFAFNQQRKFKHQQAVSDMEQRMLRLQMNPHFIFNALASIQNYILQSDTKESVSYLAKFGKLMRQILEHSREEFITIEEETDMLRNYLEIQQLRFKNRFDFKIEIDPAIDPTELQIPPLFAQPFVENAIEHGLKDKTSDGLITIRFSPEGKNIRLEVEDNGSGINTTSISNKTHKSLASIISRERLEILSKRLKMEFTMEIMNKKDSSGTYASLILPALPIA
jgi:sensor histidine kinase YesM